MKDRWDDIDGDRLDRALRLRVRIYVAIFVIAVVMVVADVVIIGTPSLGPALVGASLGAVVGLVASRMHLLSWDEVSGTVVGRLDALGASILVAYVFFVVFRGALLGSWFPAPVVGVAGLAALAGLMAGQAVGTRRGIRRVIAIAGPGQVGPSPGGST